MNITDARGRQIRPGDEVQMLVPLETGVPQPAGADAGVVLSLLPSSESIQFADDTPQHDRRVVCGVNVLVTGALAGDS